MPAYTPQEEAALRQIAMLRGMGFTDDQIFGGGAMAVGGGYGFLPYVLDAAGIMSSYNLGRGQLASGMMDREYDMVNNPYNVVGANQFYADQGGTPFLTDPTLANVPRGPAGRYGGFIDSILFPQGEGGMAGGVQQAYDPRAAQSAAAQQIGAQLPGMSGGGFSGALQTGQIPGFSSLSEKDMAGMSDDQRAQYFGLVQSTGRTSNAAGAYNDFARRYRQGGASAGGTAR